MATDNVFGHRGVVDTAGFDFRLDHPFSCVLSGPSNSGKTFFVKMLLENAKSVISKNVENIVYIYNCWQPLYDELLKLYDIKFIEGIPQTLNDDRLFPPNKNNLVVLDDVMDDASNNSEIQRLFTMYVHHKNLSALYIVQNLFSQGKSSRTISLNTNYLVLFKNPRDNTQINVLARQMYPRNTKFFMECYENATSIPFGYLLIDFKAKTPEQYRLRTDILSQYPVVYVQKRKH